jgi:hypothetical protein
MNLKGSDNGSLNIIRLGVFGIKNINRKSSAWNSYYRCSIEIFRKFFRIHRRGTDNDFKIISRSHQILDERKQNIGMKGTFVSLINNHYRITCQVWL